MCQVISCNIIPAFINKNATTTLLLLFKMKIEVHIFSSRSQKPRERFGVTNRFVYDGGRLTGKCVVAGRGDLFIMNKETLATQCRFNT